MVIATSGNGCEAHRIPTNGKIRTTLTQLQIKSADLMDLYQCYIGYGQEVDEPQFDHWHMSDPKGHLTTLGLLARVETSHLKISDDELRYGYVCTDAGYAVMRQAVIDHIIKEPLDPEAERKFHMAKKKQQDKQSITKGKTNPNVVLDENVIVSNIVSYGKIEVDDVVFHPDNPKIHTAHQRAVVRASFDELGQIAPIIINSNNNYLVDGHERVWMASDIKEEQGGKEVYLDVIYVNLTDDQHDRALEVYDETGRLALIDRDRLKSLIEKQPVTNPDMQRLRDEMLKRSLSPSTDGDDEKEEAEPKPKPDIEDAACILYVTAPDFETFQKLTRILTFDGRAPMTADQTFATIDGVDYLDKWEVLLKDTSDG